MEILAPAPPPHGDARGASILWRLAACGLALGAALGPPAAPARAAEPAREALIVGNGSYANLPPLPGCAAAVAPMAAAFRAMGFNVIERRNTGRGELDAAIATFAQRVHAAPGGAAVVYFCGYAVDFGGRTFLLPTSAAIGNDFDVLTQGMIAKSVQDAVAHGSPRAGLVLIDAVPRAESPRPAFGGAAEHAAGLSQALLAAVGPAGREGPAPIAAAAEGNLTPPGPQVAPLLEALQRRLGEAAGVELAAVSPGPAEVSLAPPPPPIAATPAPTPAPAVTPAPDAPPAPVAAAPSVPPAPRIEMPDEDRMTDADRRRVQLALATLGYYGGRIDARFGPETRAGIRRYQHEIGAEMTGVITSEQASRLVSAVR